MNKKILVAGAAVGIMLAGCQNLTEQLTSKIAEGVINSSTNGEVKVNMNDLQNGKISVTTKDGTINMSGNDQGGSMTMTDKTGKTVMTANGNDKTYTVKDETGKTVVQGDQNSMTTIDKDGTTTTMKTDSGDVRPASVPADMPSLDGAGDFAFFTINNLGTLSFTLNNKTELKGTCDAESSLITGAGWSIAANGMDYESAESIMKSYEKGDMAMLMTCGLSDNIVTVGLQESKKSS